jgi:ADP-ribose pyrophosphatase
MAKLPNGNQATREWIAHPGATAVVPIFENGDTMLLRQFRYPVKQIFFEVPAGKLDPGEDPLVTGERELTEETGIKASSFSYAGQMHPGIGYSDEVIYVFVAYGLTLQEMNVDSDEFLLPFRLPFVEALKMIEDGVLTDAKSIVALTHVKNWWTKNAPFPLPGL